MSPLKPNDEYMNIENDAHEGFSPHKDAESGRKTGFSSIKELMMKSMNKKMLDIHAE